MDRLNIVGSIVGSRNTSRRDREAEGSTPPTTTSEILPASPSPRTPPRHSVPRRPSTSGGADGRTRSRSALGTFAAIRNSVLFSSSSKDAPMFPRPTETDGAFDHLIVPTFDKLNPPPTLLHDKEPSTNTWTPRSSSSSDSLTQIRLNVHEKVHKKRSKSPNEINQLKRMASEKRRLSTSSILVGGGGASSAAPDPSRPPTSKPQRPIPIEPGETPLAYIDRLQLKANKMDIASILSSSADPFHLETLQTYMNSFDFTGLPLDISIRKFLLESRLPGETQQIDRVMETFSKSYVEANPSLFGSADQAYILAFSLIMLHTDAFNKNNKNKMTKADYVRNLSKSVDGLGKDVLEYFFDNITATPFVYGDEEIDQSQTTTTTTTTQDIAFSSPLVGSQSLYNSPSTLNVNNAKEKAPKIVDLYHLIREEPQQLDDLKADVQSVIPPKNPYSYTGTSPFLNISDLHVTFARTFILPVIMAPQETIPLNLCDYIQPDLNTIGTVSNLKVAKAGVLTRKEDLIEGGRKNTSRKWKSCGVVLTGSQLLFFKDTSWVDDIVKQIRSCDDNARDVEYATVSGLSPDEVLSLEDSLALYDISYERHPYTFRLFVDNGRQFLLQASGTDEMNEWLAFINYAASFKTAGVRMRDPSQPMSHSTETFRRPKISLSSSSDSSASSTPAPFRSFSQGTMMDLPTEPTSLTASTSLTTSLSSDLSTGPSTWSPRLVTRTEALRRRIQELDDKIEAIRSGLQVDLRLVRNLDILMPLLKTTRDKIRSTLPGLEKKVRTGRIELGKAHCYREVLVRDLLAEERDLHQYRLHHRTTSQTRFSSRRASTATYYSIQSSVIDSNSLSQFASQDEELYASDEEDERRRLSITPVLHLKRRNTGDILSTPTSPSTSTWTSNSTSITDPQTFSRTSTTTSPSLPIKPLTTTTTLRPRAHSHDLPSLNSLAGALKLDTRTMSNSSDGLVPLTPSSKTSPTSPSSIKANFAEQEINARKLSKIREERRSEMS